MKRFKFRLDPVIRYREYRERIAQLSLARETRALIESRNRISEMQQTRRHIFSELDSEQKRGIEVDRHRVFTTYLQGLHDEIESESEHLVETGKRISKKQKAVKAETIKKKSLESIRQTKYSKYLERINRAEEKAADELIGLKKHEIPN